MVFERSKVSINKPLEIIISKKNSRWSYGGNRLQVQAETHLLEDLIRALEMIRNVGMDTIGSMKSLYPKHELLGMLLSNEHTRLHVWLYPLEPDKRLSFTSHHHSPTEVNIINL